MPHLTLEHSANLNDACDVQHLVDMVHEQAAQHGLPPLVGLRTRAVARANYRIADGDPRYAFVAFTARIGPGRSAETKNEFLVLMLDTIDTFLAAEAPELVVALSGEIQEIDPDHRINRNHIRTHLKASD